MSKTISPIPYPYPLSYDYRLLDENPDDNLFSPFEGSDGCSTPCLGRRPAGRDLEHSWGRYDIDGISNLSFSMTSMGKVEVVVWGQRGGRIRLCVHDI